MTVGPPASQAKITDTLTAIGGELIGQTRQNLLQQILVACSIAGGPPDPGSTLLLASGSGSLLLADGTSFLLLAA